MTINIKSHLKRQYSQIATNGDNPEYTGNPDNILFHRGEEYEVIPMLRIVLQHLGFKIMCLRAALCLESIETLMSKSMPANVRTREEVFNWLIKNYKCIE